MTSEAPEELTALAAELRAIFDSYGLAVAVGLTHEGVVIRSQDSRVDAQNIGTVRALGGDSTA
jgi:hypothetical protein